MNGSSVSPREISEQEDFRLAAKTELLRREMSVTGLAKKIGISRNVTSVAINHGMYPTVRKKIARALRLNLSR